MSGTLQKGRLMVSEVHRFECETIKENNSACWNIPHIYHEILRGLRELSAYDEPVESISCSSWGADYFLFDSGSAFMPPSYRGNPSADAGMKEVLTKIPWEILYDETGIQRLPGNTIFQLASEKPKRLKKAKHLLPMADGFNYLLSGAARVEMSQASATQLYNPATGTWSEFLLNSLKLRPELLPQIVLAGTKLGSLRSEVARETRLEEAQVIATCSNELAAALVGLPASRGERWAFMRAGAQMSMGTQLIAPLINDSSRESKFTNETGFGGSIHFYKRVVGLGILDECKKFWKEKDRELDEDVLRHLAIGAAPFESLINPEDPVFQTPGDMPLKIQAYCKETNQVVPRKPGAIFRCVLESLALSYRKTLLEIESHTGREFSRLYLIDGSPSNLLYHFTANALQIPITLAPANPAAIGNIIVQALALGHIKSLEEAHEIVRNSFKMETITPHPTFAQEAYGRMEELSPS